MDSKGSKAEDRRLSNLQISSLHPCKEVKANLEGQSWLVLLVLLKAGQQFQVQKSVEAEQRKLEEQKGEQEEEEGGRQAEVRREVVMVVW